MGKIKEQILEMLKSSEGHMTAEEMYLHCMNNGIHVSMASVYRVLGQLADEGYIRKFSVAGQPDVFDKTLQEHEHLVCVKCGKVKDLKLSGLREAMAEQVDNFESYDLCVRYVCPECVEECP